MNNSNKNQEKNFSFLSYFFTWRFQYFPRVSFTIIFNRSTFSKEGVYTPIIKVILLTILHFFLNFGTKLTYKISKPLT